MIRTVCNETGWNERAVLVGNQGLSAESPAGRDDPTIACAGTEFACQATALSSFATPSGRAAFSRGMFTTQRRQRASMSNGQWRDFARFKSSLSILAVYSNNLAKSVSQLVELKIDSLHVIQSTAASTLAHVSAFSGFRLQMKPLFSGMIADVCTTRGRNFGWKSNMQEAPAAAYQRLAPGIQQEHQHKTMYSKPSTPISPTLQSGWAKPGDNSVSSCIPSVGKTLQRLTTTVGESPTRLTKTQNVC
eukprot:4036321-Amphidinium_carterae.1